ncbi:Ig-like domain repeat protein [Dethiobacter alkaliphilus]|uniref:Ig-like domain repeat protein n=1 Tax=Dethiobacter alkaliphilus TaxID=427926 RepID=UPI002226C0F9|nr:Ig-like domain repeat protein [Dethiobacter alkaliphilus]MCW3491319.1 Ig-like domain repeat protein [Dethiobacter alkaliphilus]
MRSSPEWLEGYNSQVQRLVAGLVVFVVILGKLIIAEAGGNNFSEHTPGDGGTVIISNPKVSVYITGEDSRLEENSVTGTLNGESVAVEFLHKGRWESDSCSSWYVVEDYTQGTASFSTFGLENGTYDVEISVMDRAGTTFTEQWSFTVATELRFVNQIPSSGSTRSDAKPRISVRAADGTKDAENVRMFVNDFEVGAAVAPLSGNVLEISYTPQERLPEGENFVRVEVFDTAEGEYKTTSWSFIVDAAPKASEWTPARGGTSDTASPRISVLVTDTFDHLDGESATAKLNGEVVDAVFRTTELHDSCGFLGYDYRSGTISFQAVGLQDGEHTFEISIADVAGNVLEESWSFTVAEAPKISDLYPENGVEVGGISEVSAVVTDNSAVDWDSVTLYRNGEAVEHSVNESTGKVTYSGDFPDGNYQIKLEVSDMAGNSSTAEWSFVTVASPPTLSDLRFFTDGMKITDGVLKFYARLNHLVDMKDNVTLKVNGEVLDIDFRFAGFWDTCTDQYFVTSRKEATVTYEDYVGDGEHTLELYAEDKFGNNRTWTWTFEVEAPPTISNVSPFKYGLEDLQPTISAVVKDNDILASIVLELNDEVIEDYEYDSVSGKLTYTPAEPLANEMNYTVTLTATDGIGLVAERTWSFNINTWPDMADSNISNCTACHENQNDRPEPYEAVHRGFLFDGHDGRVDCYSCHNYVTNLDVCDDCHNPDHELYDAPNWPPHGYNPDKTYSPRSFSDSVPLRVTTNRENWDCIICHQPGAGTQRKITNRVYEPLNNHDIPQLHRAEADNCVECHALSLTREHARDGRTDEDGNPITCQTCHESTREDVKTAITTRNLDCGACHGIETTADGHADMHDVSLGAQCVSCHGDNMIYEEVYHEREGCKECHSNPDPRVQRAIQFQNRTCFGCHEEPHGVKISVIRDDIPLYGGVSWSKPDPVSVWAGEGWLHDELNNDMALVLYSSAAQLSSSAVNQFYKTEMADKGWTLLEEVPGDDGAFSLMFKKGRRHCLILFYQGMTPLSGGGQGYRIMTVYN